MSLRLSVSKDLTLIFLTFLMSLYVYFYFGVFWGRESQPLIKNLFQFKIKLQNVIGIYFKTHTVNIVHFIFFRAIKVTKSR